MSKFLITAGVLAGFAVALVAAPQDDPADMMPPVLEQHEWLARQVGEWDAKLEFYMPEGTIQSEGRETVEMFGPYVQRSHFESEFMGIPFQGSATISYNAASSKWVGTWIDSMTPFMSMMSGRWDAAANTLTLSYEAPNMMGGLDEMKSVIALQDDDHHTFTAYVVGEDGSETKQMHITYTRRQARGGGGMR